VTVASDGRSAAEVTVPGLLSLLDGITEAVIVQDAAGRVQLLNAAARALFPDLDLGDQFDARGESFVVQPGGRRVSGALRPLPDGWQAWVVSEVPGDAASGLAGDMTGEDARRRDFLLAASRELAAGVGREAAAATLVRMAVPTLGERAAVLLPAPRARVSWWRFGAGEARPVSGVARAPAPRTAPVLAAALRGAHKGTVAVPAGELAALAVPLGPHLTGREPVVVTPLRGPDRMEGLLVVVRPVEVELLAPLAALAGPVLEAGRRQQDQAAALSQLQAPLLPPKPDELPELPEVQLGVAHRPAAGELAVGGDFYLIRPIPEGGAVFGLGDVCGKGAEALAESSRVQHSLAALMVIEQDPTQLLYLLNRALLAGGRSVFTTLVLGELHQAQPGLRLTLATGGHPAPMVLRNDGEVEEIGVPGTVVGILPEARFGKTVLTLAPGETCVCYSDGVTEAGRRTGEGDEQFGPARLINCLRGCAGMTAQEVVNCVEQTVRDWLDRNDRDDLAVLAVRALPADPG
jgi:serine phosphatase RsbU (regulator of sigma subunit)